MLALHRSVKEKRIAYRTTRCNQRQCWMPHNWPHTACYFPLETSNVLACILQILWYCLSNLWQMISSSTKTRHKYKHLYAYRSMLGLHCLFLRTRYSHPHLVQWIWSVILRSRTSVLAAAAILLYHTTESAEKGSAILELIMRRMSYSWYAWDPNTNNVIVFIPGGNQFPRQTSGDPCRRGMTVLWHTLERSAPSCPFAAEENIVNRKRRREDWLQLKA